MIKIKIKSVFGKLLFEYEKENNTIKDTLHEANLRGAYLRGADLRGANLHGANWAPMFCGWETGTSGDLIKIGCKENTIKEWDRFFSSSEEFDTKPGTEEFFRIEAMYLATKAYKLKMDEYKPNQD